MRRRRRRRRLQGLNCIQKTEGCSPLSKIPEAWCLKHSKLSIKSSLQFA
jgi:hypothetical protein